MSWKVNGSCIGCGACTEIAPEIFEMTGDGVAAVTNQPGSGGEAAAREAQDACPVGAIEEE